MKNKVLRLAIVAVIVVAMVLSTAACVVNPPVDPSPTPGGTSPSPTPTTTTSKTPGKPTPEAGSDEAALESKYGITFPVADGMTVKSFIPATTTTPVIEAYHTVIDKDENAVEFGPEYPKNNAAFNAYAKAITVTSKVTGVTKEGVKVTITRDENKPDAFVPTAAGTYTVTYTVKVNFNPEDPYGFFKPAKVSETYTVVKTYEVAKKKITIESVSDATEKTKKMEFKPAVMNYSVADAKEIARIQEELKIDAAGGLNLSADILGVDSTAYGAYPMNLICTKGTKKEVVDVATLISPNYEVTFKNGSRYILTDVELAAAIAANDDVTQAGKANANKDEIELGIATYAALSEGAKTYYATNEIVLGTWGKENLLAMNINKENLSKVGMVDEAKKLAKVWNDKLQNTEDGKTFLGYMIGLSTKVNQSAVTNKKTASDYKYVIDALTVGGVKDAYLLDAVKLVTDYRTKMIEDFMAEAVSINLLLSEVDGRNSFSDINGITKLGVEAATNALAKLKATYEALLADQKGSTIAEINVDPSYKDKTGNQITYPADTYYSVDFKLDEIMAKFTAFNDEFVARFDAYSTLIVDLDAYTDTTKPTLAGMTSLLGYQFHKKSINNDLAGVTGPKPEKFSASKILFGLDETGDEATDKFLKFATPLAFVADATASFKKYVDAYVALDAAIVEEQVKIISTLGSRLADAGNKDYMVESFDGKEFIVSSTAENNKLLMYVALQKYLGEQIVANVYTVENLAGNPPTDAIHFAGLEKKELAEVIAAAVKGPVNDMNSWIKESAETGDNYKPVAKP